MYPRLCVNIINFKNNLHTNHLTLDKKFNCFLYTYMFFKSKTRTRWMYLLSFPVRFLIQKGQLQTSLQILNIGLCKYPFDSSGKWAILPLNKLKIGVPSDFVFPTLNLNLEHQGGSLAEGKGRFAQLALICDKNIYLLNLFSIASAYMSMGNFSKL